MKAVKIPQKKPADAPPAPDWMSRADEHLKRKDWRRSLAILESAAKASPDDPFPYLKAAAILRLLGKKEAWLHLLGEAQSRTPEPGAGSSSRGPHRTGAAGRRVVLMAGERSMVVQDCREGFARMGWEARQELFGNTSHEGPEAHEHLAIRIRSRRPRLVISINQAGCDREGFILAALKDAGIPAVVWYVDSPFAILPEDRPSMVRDAALLASFDASYVEPLREGTGVTAIHLPLGTNPERFKPPETEDPEADWPMSFIGGLDLDRIARGREALGREVPGALKKVDEAVRVLTSSPFASARDALKARAAERPWNGVSPELRGRILRLAELEASAKRRIEIVAALREEGIRVAGGAEWKAYVPPGQWHPPVDYLTDLCGLYRRSRIVLNISRYQLRSGVTQRVFDVPAAGGFLLTDRTEELERYLLPGREAAVYEDVKDLKEKAAFFLAHEEERKAVALTARRRVLREHTYPERLRTIIAALSLS